MTAGPGEMITGASVARPRGGSERTAIRIRGVTAMTERGPMKERRGGAGVDSRGEISEIGSGAGLTGGAGTIGTGGSGGVAAGSGAATEEVSDETKTAVEIGRFVEIMIGPVVTTIEEIGISPVVTTIEETGISPVVTTIKGTGISPVVTTIKGTGISPGVTTIKGTGISPGVTTIKGTGISPGVTTIKGTGISPGVTTIKGTGISPGVTTIKGTGISPVVTTIEGASGEIITTERGSEGTAGTGTGIGRIETKRAGVIGRPDRGNVCQKAKINLEAEMTVMTGEILLRTRTKRRTIGMQRIDSRKVNSELIKEMNRLLAGDSTTDRVATINRK